VQSDANSSLEPESLIIRENTGNPFDTGVPALPETPIRPLFSRLAAVFPESENREVPSVSKDFRSDRKLTFVT